MRMLKKNSKFLLILMMILSWLTLPFIGKDVIKKYLPASLFMSLVVRIVNIVAKKRTWWVWYEHLHPKLSGVFPFIWGPFLVGTMWILKLTYGKFYRFMFLNLIVDSFFTYVLVGYLKQLRIASLVRFNKIQLSLVFFVESFILYGFQYFKEKMADVKE